MKRLNLEKNGFETIKKVRTNVRPKKTFRIHKQRYYKEDQKKAVRYKN